MKTKEEAIARIHEYELKIKRCKEILVQHPDDLTVRASIPCHYAAIDALKWAYELYEL